MREGEFLFGKALSERIRQVCSADKVDCAVAFWGGSIRDSLFPRWGQQTIRIVCDIAMGCNSQKSLGTFDAPNNPRLKVLDGLHAKVYVSKAGAVVGSANASSNGIGLASGEEGNTEAGIFLAAGSAGWRRAQAFFTKCWKAAQPLDQNQLDRAPIATRDPGRRIVNAGPRASAVLDLVASYPDELGDILFIAEQHALKKREERALKADFDQYAEASEDLDADVQRTLVLRCAREDLPFVPASVVMFFREQMRAYSSVVEMPVGDQLTFWGVKDWRAFWAERRFSPRANSFPAHHIRFVRSLDDGMWALRARDLGDCWRRHSPNHAK